MPLRQTLQRVITANDFTNKSFRFTAVPGPDQSSSTQLANTSPENKPALLVSHPMLTFARTSPGRPTFIILTLSQQHTDTPVTLSTDAPDQFQLATDDRPAFSPSLTFIPSPTGTYVHVRYTANRMGFHKGKLFIETPYESRTLAMKGSNWNLLPPSHTPHYPARTTQAVHVDQVFSGGWRTKVMLAVAVGGLALGSYFYRGQLFTKTDSDHSLISVNQEPSSPLTSSESLKTTAYTTVELDETQTAQSNRKQTRKKRSARRQTTDSLREKHSVTQPASISHKPAFVSKNSFNTDSQQANARSRRQTVTGPSPEESELERVLNRKVQQ